MLLLTLLLPCLTSAADWPTISLKYPPSQLLLVGEGVSTNITFYIDGNPFPRDKYWYKDGAKLTSSSFDDSGSRQSLVLNTIQRSAAGTYQLIIKEPTRTQETTISQEVIVKVAYLGTTFKKSDQKVSVTRRNFAVLQCYPPDHFASTIKYAWSKDGSEITPSDYKYISEQGNLVIMQADTSDISSNYRCIITIESLKAGQRTRTGPAVTLQVTGNAPASVNPSIALYPSDRTVDSEVKPAFKVECVTNGYPSLPSVQWYINGKRITSSSSIYDVQDRGYIKVTLPTNGGNIGGAYQCKATDPNTGMVVTATANVKVNIRPELTTSLSTSEIKKSSDAELKLTCIATGTPNPSFTWYNDGEKITTEGSKVVDRGSLQISPLSALNDGIYQCEAKNDVGSVISTTKVSVQERLAFVIRPADVEVFLGVAATFNCMGKGTPGPTSIQWKFNDKTPPSRHEFTNDITNQATYKISKVTSQDQGNYKCIISSPENLYSSDEATAVLTIKEGPQVRALKTNITMNEYNTADITCLVENVANKVTWKWLQDGQLVTVPDNQRITITNNLLIIRSLGAKDAGTYTCQADENGLSNNANIYLKVLTSPVITMKKEVRIGEAQDAVFECNAEGNPVPTFQWYKKSVIVTEDAKYSISTVGTKSVLTVKSVNKGNDVGEWKCKATNSLGYKIAVANLFVVAQCEVMNMPQNQTLSYEETITLECTVNDCANAQWNWFKGGAEMVFDNNAKRQRLNNGAKIVVYNSLPSDSGEYTCQVTNPLTQARLNYTATVTVTVPAHIYEFPPNDLVLFKNQETVTMSCSARGEYDDSGNQMSINWYQSSILVTSQEMRDDDRTEKIMSITKVLVIQGASSSDSGLYVCVASNKWGSDKKTVSLMMKTYPNAPGQPFALWTSSGAIELSWPRPTDTGNTPLTSYEMEIDNKDTDTYRTYVKDLDPNKVTYVVFFLYSNRDYKFRVIAVNDVGKSPASAPSATLTTFENQNQNTLNLVNSISMSAISSDSIAVSWEVPEPRSSRLIGYKIVYRDEMSFEEAKFLTVDRVSTIRANLTDLRAGAEYSVQIWSDTSVSSQIVVSSVRTVTTLNNVPSTPLDCEAERESGSKIVVKWSTPNRANGKILAYTISFRDMTKTNGVWISQNGTSRDQTTYVISNIDNGMDYDVKVAAWNSAGQSQHLFCTNTGKIINKPVFKEWWFYLIVAVAGLLVIGVIVVLIILCVRRCCSAGPVKAKPLGPVKVPWYACLTDCIKCNCIKANPTDNKNFIPLKAETPRGSRPWEDTRNNPQVYTAQSNPWDPKPGGPPAAGGFGTMPTSTYRPPGQFSPVASPFTSPHNSMKFNKNPNPDYEFKPAYDSKPSFDPYNSYSNKPQDPYKSDTYKSEQPYNNQDQFSSYSGTVGRGGYNNGYDTGPRRGGAPAFKASQL